MPVEVKELIIRAKIVDSVETSVLPQQEGVSQQKAAIIAACVEQVLKILETKKER